MAEIQEKDKNGPNKDKAKKKSLRIDFTPMVDLGFLLTTFFMLTTSLLKPQAIEICMPAKKINHSDSTKVPFHRAVTLVLAKNNKVYYYFGTCRKNKDPDVIVSDFSPDDVRKMLLHRNAEVIKNIENLKKDRILNKKINNDTLKARIMRAKCSKNSPIIIIKATADATFKNLVDALDEMLICNIGSYSINDISAYDLKLIHNKVSDQINHKLKS